MEKKVISHAMNRHWEKDKKKEVKNHTQKKLSTSYDSFAVLVNSYISFSIKGQVFQYSKVEI